MTSEHATSCRCPKNHRRRRRDAGRRASRRPARRGRATLASTRGPARDARFHIFVIDSGWNCAASKVLREHLNMISDLHIDDELFVLDRATSIALLRHYPLQVGRDPIIAVHDLRPRHRHRVKHTHGFRMHLGILDSEEQVLAALRMFARFLITHRNAADIDESGSPGSAVSLKLRVSRNRPSPRPSPRTGRGTGAA